MDQDFLDFIHRQPRLQSFSQRGSQLFQIAVGGESGDGDNALLFCAQCLVCVHILCFLFGQKTSHTVVACVADTWGAR